VSEPAKRIVATILGCASSGGVPRVGNNWGKCDPANPRNRRRRCSLLLTGTSDNGTGATQVLVDTGADLREQLLDAQVGHLDAVLYTHEHADHTHGIDDLRALALSSRSRLNVYFSQRTGDRLKAAFGYCFTAPHGSPYPPILNGHEIDAGDTLTVDGPGGSIDIRPVLQDHGDITTFGFKVGRFVYSCDVSGIPEISTPDFEDLSVWVLDALRPVPHPSHFGLHDALEHIERFKPRQAVLTNMHVDMDYAEVDELTPDNVKPAHDGLQIDVTTGRVMLDRC